MIFIYLVLHFRGYISSPATAAAVVVLSVCCGGSAGRVPGDCTRLGQCSAVAGADMIKKLQSSMPPTTRCMRR